MSTRRGSIPAGRDRRGLTLIELMLAVSITAFIGAAIAVVMTAAGQNLSRVGEVRSALQRSHAMQARLQAYMDASLCILDEDPDLGFAVWLHDDNPGGTINLSELRVLWYDTADEEISVEWFVFPEGLTELERDTMDIEIPVGSDYYTIMLTQRGLGQTARLVIADAVVSFDLAHDAVSFLDATRLRATTALRVNASEAQEMLFAIGINDHTVPQ